MIPKLEESFAALAEGVRRIHVVGRLAPGDLAREAARARLRRDRPRSCVGDSAGRRLRGGRGGGGRRGLRQLLRVELLVAVIEHGRHDEQQRSADELEGREADAGRGEGGIGERLPFRRGQHAAGGCPGRSPAASPEAPPAAGVSARRRARWSVRALARRASGDAPGALSRGHLPEDPAKLLHGRSAARGARHDDPKPLRQYTNEEAASIITRVLERQNGEGGRISHDELLETAREIGITTLELEEAVVEETRLRAERIVLEEERQAERQKALKVLLRHLAAYVVIGAFCFVLGVRVTGGVWYVWVLLLWGLGVGAHALRALLPNAVDRRLAATDAGKRQVEVHGGKLELKEPGG